MNSILNAKKACIRAAISLLLCVSMLIGTTYAWFSDSITNNNIIHSGTLDVELEFARSNNGTISDWETVSKRSDIFDPNAKWEPGRTEVVYLKVSNIGSLALKYRLSINVIRELVGLNQKNEDIMLSEHLVFTVVEMNDTLKPYTDREAAILAAGSSIGIKNYNGPVNVLGTGEEDYLACIVYMPKELDNSVNHNGKDVPLIELGINLIATQVEYETDSFGTDYDADCDFPKSYGFVIDEHTNLDLNGFNLDIAGNKNIDALIHITDNAVVNIHGNTNRVLNTNGLDETPVISSDSGSVINIYGGSYSAKDVPILDISNGTVANIYRGMFRADSFTGSDSHTSQLFNCAEDEGCSINVYGGTFINFDPRVSDLGNLVADSHVVLTTERSNGEIWYTVVHEDYKDYTPVFDISEIEAAFAAGLSEIVIACDIDVTPNTESLMYGKPSQTLYVNGHHATITPDGTGTAPGYADYGYVAFIPDPGCDAVVSDLRVVGRGFVEVGHHGQGGGTYTVTNLIVEDLIATLHVNNGGNNVALAFSQYGTATLKNCVMTGVTTEKVGYKPYDAGFVNGTKTFIEGGRYGKVYLSHQAHVTITGAEIDTIDAYTFTSSNGNKVYGKLTVGAGAKIGTINIFTTGSYKPSLIIEDGAEVGEIIYNGVSYTVEQWRAR